MSYDIPTDMPAVFTAGDTLTFTRDLADYRPADGWTLTYTLVKTGSQIQFSGSDNGDGTHLISVAATTTADWSAGDYRWQATVAYFSERRTVGRGTITVRANFSAETAGYDGRSTWQAILDDLEAAYAALASGSVASATVAFGDKQVTYRSLGELTKAISMARQEAARESQEERLAQGLPTGNRLQIRF